MWMLSRERGRIAGSERYSPDAESGAMSGWPSSGRTADARMPVMQVCSGKRGITAGGGDARLHSRWLGLDEGGDTAPVVTVRGLSCGDSWVGAGSWSIAPRWLGGKSKSMPMDECVDEGSESSSM
jgi:hypothetical protein